MLTKDLVKYKIRKGKVYPDLVKIDNSDALNLAGKMLSIKNVSVGKTQNEIDLYWEDLGVTQDKLYPGFKKLISDKLTWQEPDDTLIDKRWDLIKEAQVLRTETLFSSYEEFREEYSATQVQPFDEISENLYADLPENRKMVKFAEEDDKALLYRYNCSQIQSLLIRAKFIDLDLTGCSLPERRTLFRFIKFHQLVAEVSTDMKSNPFDSGEMSVRISGPLSVLQNAQTYGLRLASFFPRVLHLSSWKLYSEIDLAPKKKGLQLELAPCKELKSHYNFQSSYIPEEIKDFMDVFNKKSEHWKVEEGRHFIHLGRQSYCFPDFSFYKVNSEPVHMELFHKWHKGQLENRLQILTNYSARNILLGIHRNLFKSEALFSKINNSSWFKSNGVTFVDFPTPKSILSILGSR